MPKKTRMVYKRELERAVGNIEWAQKHLASVIEAYAEHHPDIALTAQTIGLSLDQVIEVIKQLNRKI